MPLYVSRYVLILIKSIVIIFILVLVLAMKISDCEVDGEVIIDVACGVAVLRGANIFTAGILAMSPGNKSSSLQVSQIVLHCQYLY